MATIQTIINFVIGGTLVGIIDFIFALSPSANNGILHTIYNWLVSLKKP